MAQRLFWTASALTGVFSSLLPAFTFAAPLPSSLPASQLDWHSWGDNRPEGELCSGYYLAPSYSISRPGQGKLNSQSDDAGYSDSGVTTLSGNVIVRQQDQQLQAGKATLDEDRSRVNLTGPVTYRQPNVLVRGTTGSAAVNSDAADVEQAHYVFHSSHARGDADRLERLDDGRYMMRNATFTSCDPDSTLWKIQGDKIVINRAEGYGTSTNTKFRIHDVPVFYWPWMRFPIDDRRLTGLLYPTIGVSSRNGFDYTQPIYLNLAPNYDATVTPRYMSDRGLMLGGQFRYRGERNAGILEGNYLPNDGGHSSGNDPEHHGDDRWFINYDHNGSFTDRLTYRMKYSRASDGSYFDDFGDTFDEQNRDNLQSLAMLDYAGDVWHLQARARGYQVMDDPVDPDDKPFNELPSLTANALWQQENGFYEEFNSNATYFYRNESHDYYNRDVHWRSDDMPGSKDYLTQKVTGARVNVAPAIGYRNDPTWGFFEPRVQMYLTQYDVDWKSPQNRDWDSSPNRTVPVFSVDSGLIFERHSSMFGHAYRQTLTPRLYYAYVPYRDQSKLPEFDTALRSPSFEDLWSPYRFNGIDRIGDVNKISYGVSSSFFDDDTGFQRFTFDLGQSYYFENRHVTDDDPSKYFGPNGKGPRDKYNYDLTRDYSPAIARATWHINRDWSASYAMFYDTERGNAERNDLYVHYHNADNGNAFNLGNRWEREGFDPSGDRDDRLGYNRNEFDVSGSWAISPSVSLVGRYLYDQTNSRSLEKLAGIQFNDCCYAVQVAWRKYIDDNDTLNRIDDDDSKSGVFLRFIFKGLGGLGSDPEPYFQDAVPGYQRTRF
ncbi:LPS-assembly protein LptD [Carnimonas sp. R-84981]|uniref:LPS-assembly protein LptD n=1 Tax=Carnimonas bestiolae TaxID=3402172 RepID=UPI003EDC52D0